MDKVVKLRSVVKLLKDEAQEANRKASECVGVDNDADAYFQGLRNGYLQAAKLLEQKSEQLA
ncbi:MAG: hypothetical protein Q7S43_03005 [bacterium]|nr:hypothetical protein [bacterium]MDO8496397.1 hypothetical protein [bacterium]